MNAARVNLLDVADQGDQVVASPTTSAKGDFWRGYSPDTTDDEARRLFVARFGELPATVVRVKGLVLAGPLPSPRVTDGASTGSPMAPLTGLRRGLDGAVTDPAYGAATGGRRPTDDGV